MPGSESVPRPATGPEVVRMAQDFAFEDNPQAGSPHDGAGAGAWDRLGEGLFLAAVLGSTALLIALLL